MVSEPRIITADDVADLPRPRGVRGYEFVDGQLIELVEATPANRRFASRVQRLISDHVIEMRLPGCVLGDVAFALSSRWWQEQGAVQERVRIADIAYVAREDVEGYRDPDRVLHGAPELVIEVEQRNDRKPGGTKRLIDFFEAGARVIWVLDAPGRAALVYNRGEGARTVREHDVVHGAPALPGLRLTLADVLALS